MVLKSDKEKVKTLLSETIRLLCKNGLHFKSEFSVEALVGITLDKDQEFFLSIKETVKTDIPLPKPESRSQKEARRSSAKEVKGEPNEPPSCVRKRPSETVTNNCSPSDLPPSLSLGDMHDNESGFWGPEGDDGGGQATKKKRIDPNDDDSNSNVITIKGEPGSDSDDDVACMGESSDRDSQMDQTMGDMSGSFMYATPVTSEQSMMGGLPPGGSMPQGVWDHLPQFPIPGPSGMAGGADVSQDGQQPRGAFMLHGSTYPGSSPRPIKVPHKTASDDFEYIAKRILMQKGTDVYPRGASMACAGMTTVEQVILVMQGLDSQGIGEYNPDYIEGKQRPKKVFIKKPLFEIRHQISRFKITEDLYDERFNASPLKRKRPSTSSIVGLKGSDYPVDLINGGVMHQSCPIETNWQQTPKLE